MICLSLLLQLAAAQNPANHEADFARQAWNGLQERFQTAAAVSFQATGDFLSTSAQDAGRTLATIQVSVSVAKPGFGEIHVSAHARGTPAEASVNASSFGTEEGIWSVAHGSDRAFGCGVDWNQSTELDDFVFLGSAWSGWCARRGAADVVQFVPAHAEHPGLTGLRVRWNATEDEAHRSAIFWLDADGGLHSADVRVDAQTVLHWNFTGFATPTECDPAQFVAFLPQGFHRDGFEAAEASAEGTVGLTGAADPNPSAEPSPIQGLVGEAIQQGAQQNATQQQQNANGAPANTGATTTVKPATGTPAPEQPVTETPAKEDPANEDPNAEQPPVQDEPVSDDPAADGR